MVTILVNVVSTSGSASNERASSPKVSASSIASSPATPRTVRPCASACQAPDEHRGVAVPPEALTSAALHSPSQRLCAPLTSRLGAASFDRQAAGSRLNQQTIAGGGAGRAGDARP